MKIVNANRRQRIHFRVRKKVSGTAARPRLSVFRSNQHIYCQIIDDVNGSTLGSASSMDSSVGKDLSKVEKASEVGKLIAKVATGVNISTVVFDRGGFLYHGRVKALADGARQGGLQF